MPLSLRVVLVVIDLCFFFPSLVCKQAAGKDHVMVGYIMKLSREEDFAKVGTFENKTTTILYAFEKRRKLMALPQ